MRFPADRMEQRGFPVPSQPGSHKTQDFQISSLGACANHLSYRQGWDDNHLTNLQRVLCTTERFSDLKEVTEPQ